MLRRALPGSALGLPPLIVGCWAMGGDYWGEDVRDADSVAAIHAALEVGLDCFDTAPLYGHGHADRLLAQALKGREATVLTKVGVRTEGEHALSDLSPEHLEADLHASLRRLGRERIDLLQVHWPCERGTPLEASFGALARFREQGKVGEIGVCNYGPEALAELRSIAPVVSLQSPYSLLRRELEGPLRARCGELGLGILAYEPLCRGLLSGKYKPGHRFPASDQRSWDERFAGRRFLHNTLLVEDLERVARKVEAPLPALALAWVIAQPGVHAAIVGVKRPAQLRENLQALRLARRPRLMALVSKVAALHGGA